MEVINERKLAKTLSGFINQVRWLAAGRGRAGRGRRQGARWACWQGMRRAGLPIAHMRLLSAHPRPASCPLLAYLAGTPP